MDQIVTKRQTRKRTRKQEILTEVEEPEMKVSKIGAKVLEIAAKSSKYLGAHVSAAGGVDQSVKNAASIGCRSFALFLRNQRTWNSKPLPEDMPQKFKDACKKYGISPAQILPHGSYLLNAGSPDSEILRKTREVLVDEAKRCEALGINFYNFHPGSSVGKISADECMKLISETINLVHNETSSVILVIETMAGQGNTIGGKFEELKTIIDAVDDKSRIGVCLDTCHIFAAGYDIRSATAYKKTMEKFEKIVGFEYLRAVHLNDSRGACGCNLDRHENIGKGQLGKAAFNHLMNDKRFDSIPMVLETPDGDYDKEMLLLHKLEQ